VPRSVAKCPLADSCIAANSPSFDELVGGSFSTRLTQFHQPAPVRFALKATKVLHGGETTICARSRDSCAISGRHHQR
jgi:hypothetical protein